MRVNRVEEPEGELKTIEMVRTNEANFKAAIKTWIAANYPDWDMQDFFNRLVSFNASSCVIDVS